MSIEKTIERINLKAFWKPEHILPQAGVLGV